MSKLFSLLCALLPLALSACAGNPPSRDYDSSRPMIEVRPGKPRQEFGAREFEYKGRPIFLGDASYFHVEEAWASKDDKGQPAVEIQLTSEDEEAAKVWVSQHVGQTAAILLEGHVLLSGVVQPPRDRPIMLTGGRVGYSQSEVDFLVKLLNGNY